MGKLTSAKTAPYLVAQSTDLSRSALATLRVHRATSVELQPTRKSLDNVMGSGR